MSEIQLQKKNTNIFCYCNFVARGGKIIVEIQVSEYNPETEENIDLEDKEYSIEDFVTWIKKEKWIVC